MTEKTKVASIFLHRVEGTIKEVENQKITFLASEEKENLFDLVEKVLTQWSYTAPNDGSYNKVDFTIIFQDRKEYKGRYDLTFNRHTKNGGGSLSEHIKRFLKFYVEKPYHLELNQWKNYIAWVTKANLNFTEECKDLLNNYQLE